MNDAEWKELAAQNPRRVTYPNWRPREQRLAEAKADPWVPIEGNRRLSPRYAPKKTTGKKVW